MEMGLKDSDIDDSSSEISFQDSLEDPDESREKLRKHLFGLKKILRSFSGGAHAMKRQEFKEALEMIDCKVSDKEFEKLFYSADTNRNGFVDIREFAELVLKDFIKMHEEVDKCLDAFRVYDPGDTGFVSILDLRTALSELGDKLSEEEWNEFVRISDTECDGQINYEEATRIFFSNISYVQHKKLQ